MTIFFARVDGRKLFFHVDGRTRGFGRGAFRVVGRACRAEPPLVRITCKRRIPSVQNHAGGRKLRNSCVRSLLMISGIMISQHVFAFLGISGGANFARKAHMLASHWYFLFMSLHIGLHAGMISRKVAAKSKRTTVGNQADGGQKVGVRRVCTVYGSAPSLATTRPTTTKRPSAKWLKRKKICAFRLL